jgi:hypothetical protein
VFAGRRRLFRLIVFIFLRYLSISIDHQRAHKSETRKNKNKIKTIYSTHSYRNLNDVFKFRDRRYPSTINRLLTYPKRRPTYLKLINQIQLHNIARDLTVIVVLGG